MSFAMSNPTAKVRKGNTPPREKDDFYRTPADVTRALLSVERFPPRVWEPACGDGAISEILADCGHDVISTDLVDRGYGEARHDFLMAQTAMASAVVTNPPFKLADEFVLHALRLGVDKVAMFMRLAWLEGGGRYARLWAKHPPSRVWVFAKRQTLWRGDDPDPQSKGGTIAYAWFVWERGHPGPTLGWIA